MRDRVRVRDKDKVRDRDRGKVVDKVAVRERVDRAVPVRLRGPEPVRSLRGQATTTHSRTHPVLRSLTRSTSRPAKRSESH